MKRTLLILIVILAAAAVIYFSMFTRPHQIVLTGIVTTDDVIVSSEIQGRLEKLLVNQGDVVKQGDLLALIQPQEQQANMLFYHESEQQAASQVAQAKADLENTRLNYEREDKLFHQGADSQQAYDQARTANDSAKAHLEALLKQMQAAAAQKDRAKVQLDYTEIRSPINGTVDVRAALQGEVVNIGQGIVTIINPDDLWVRADVEETYIDSIHIGQKMTVRLPSGAEREGTVFFRGIDADYATQRDVSRTKRDIKTFEIRLRCDNRDRSLAVGMTAYVLLPLPK